MYGERTAAMNSLTQFPPSSLRGVKEEGEEEEEEEVLKCGVVKKKKKKKKGGGERRTTTQREEEEGAVDTELGGVLACAVAEAAEREEEEEKRKEMAAVAATHAGLGVGVGVGVGGGKVNVSPSAAAANMNPVASIQQQLSASPHLPLVFELLLRNPPLLQQPVRRKRKRPRAYSQTRAHTYIHADMKRRYRDCLTSRHT